MEFASYLAGERWSDHPACTDPVLASLARAVNDGVQDDRRDELVVDIPRVIGLRAEGKTAEAAMRLVVALRAATMALPVASVGRQRTLATAIVAIQQALAERGIPTPGRLAADTAAALADVPDATTWARQHLARWPVRIADLLRGGCEITARTAAVGIAEACVLDPDALLIATLRAAIADAEALVAQTAPSADNVVRVERRVLTDIPS